MASIQITFLCVDGGEPTYMNIVPGRYGAKHRVCGARWIERAIFWWMRI